MTPEPQGKIAVAHTELLSFGTSQIHGRGGFARRRLPSGTRVIQYVGQRITKSESIKRCALNNEYIFALDDEEDLDGDVSWNAARLLNHSCTPNCEAHSEEGDIWIVAIREIQAGEEVTFNYGYDLEDYKEHPCKCGSAACVGYMVAEELFPHVIGGT
jgi:uncharacterized protein